VFADFDSDRPLRRRCSREENPRIRAEADRCKGRVEVAALLCKESFNRSHLRM
jgi:hypothetical protein